VWSSAADSDEENSLIAIRDRAMHRGQCSISSQRARGLIVSEQRGQFNIRRSWPLATAGRHALITASAAGMAGAPTAGDDHDTVCRVENRLVLLVPADAVAFVDATTEQLDELTPS
jgi:hypothetical protein